VSVPVSVSVLKVKLANIFKRFIVNGRITKAIFNSGSSGIYPEAPDA